MLGLRYSIRKDWLFYLFLASYAYLVTNMTHGLWFGDSVNIFLSYTSSPDLVDANKVYWSKTSFLFSLLLLMALRFDFRMAAGLGAVFWSSSLIWMYGPTINLSVACVIGLGLITQQILRGEMFNAS